MHMRSFPGLAVAIPVGGLGGWGIGGRAYGAVDREVARAAVIRFIELGGRFIDTAEAYGASEEIIGSVLADLRCRERVVLATKTQHHRPAEIRRSLDQSLRRLQTDWIDVYQLHQPPEDDATMAEVLDTYDELRAVGKIRLIGASVKGPRVTGQTAELCRCYLRTSRVHALQVIYSLLRPGNAVIFDEAARAGVAIIARTVLESGFLSGRYAPGHLFAEGEHRQRWSPAQLDRILGAVRNLAAELPAGVESVPEFAIRYALTPPEVSVMIPGAKSPQQVERNWAAAGRGPLSGEEIEMLTRRFTGLAEDANPG